MKNNSESTSVIDELIRVVNGHPNIIKLLEERRNVGIEKYGRELMTDTELDSLKEIKEELADALIYLHHYAMNGFSSAKNNVDFSALIAVVGNTLESLEILTNDYRGL